MNLPESYKDVMSWKWPKFELIGERLMGQTLSEETILEWLEEVSRLLSYLYEINGRLAVKVDQDNSDSEAKEKLAKFRNEIWTAFQKLEHRLESKLLDSQIIISEYEKLVKVLKGKSEIFSDANISLSQSQQGLRNRYEEESRSKLVKWQDEGIPIGHAQELLTQEPNREKRKELFERILEQRLKRKSSYDEIWTELFAIRQEVAKNSGQKTFRDFSWKSLGRIDFSPDDVLKLCESIEIEIVPLVEQYQKEKAAELGLQTLKPWGRDFVPALGLDLAPYESRKDWLNKTEEVCEKITPDFANFFRILLDEEIIDIEAWPNKSAWNYAEWLPASSRSFVFTNGTGSHNKIPSLFHEIGHAFNQIEMSKLLYFHQKRLPDEISEIASTTMELICGEELNCFYPQTAADSLASRHLVRTVLELPTIAMVAKFQHWAYTHPELGGNPEKCDKYWAQLWNRFVPGVDFEGYEEDISLQW